MSLARCSAALWEAQTGGRGGRGGCRTHADKGGRVLKVLRLLSRLFWTPVFTQLFVSANQNQTLQCALAIILTSNIIQHFTYFWRGCSSSVTYLLSFCVPGSGAGNWGYKKQRMRVRKNSLVIRQADVWQSILILLHFLIVIIWNALFFFFKVFSTVDKGIFFFFRC